MPSAGEAAAAAAFAKVLLSEDLDYQQSLIVAAAGDLNW